MKSEPGKEQGSRRECSYHGNIKAVCFENTIKRVLKISLIFHIEQQQVSIDCTPGKVFQSKFQVFINITNEHIHGDCS